MAAQCNLNAQDCSLGLQLLQLPDGGETVTPPSQAACSFAWHGARGTIGVSGGRYRFSVRILQVRRLWQPGIAATFIRQIW